MTSLCVPLLLLAAPYQPTSQNLEARRWFQDARFGLFIHWGVYSVLGDGEWVMNNKKIPITEYEKLPPQFNPTRYDAAEWVRIAKDAGMRYITITSKHHDGFAMWDSKVSNYDIADRTPYKKDVLKMLAAECHKQGIKLFFYHSHLDWHHPDYYPRGRTGLSSGRPESGDWFRYLDYMDAQIQELLTGYGPIGGIWFDGWWDKPKADWRLQKTYDLIHRLQPAALIGNNHHQPPFEGEDFQMFEKDLPGQNTAGFNAESKIGNLPLETCETINRAWGYNQTDHRYKSTRELIHYLVRAAGHNANFLLNVGPRPDGTIQPEFVDRLRQMGAWLRTNGESVYGTRGGPLPPRDWGVTTQKDNKIYLHVLKLDDDVLALPKFDRKITRITRLDGRAVPHLDTKFGLVLQIPLEGRDPYDTVLVLQ
jgi:alpha-L-fucosidase